MFLFKGKKNKFFLSREIEPNEILMDSLARRYEKKTGISEQKLEVPILERTIYLFLFFSFIVLFFLFSATFYLQIIQKNKYVLLAERNSFSIKKIQANRGIIYDKNFNQLVSNRFSFDLAIDRDKFLKLKNYEQDALLKELAQILKKEPEELAEKIKKGEEKEIILQENLSQEAIVVLEIRKNDLEAIKIIEHLTRDYKEGPIFSHIIGYTGKANSEEIKKEPDFYSSFSQCGRAGIESFYEKILRRDPGKMKIMKDAKGNIISQEIVSSPKSGGNLVLWIDGDLQRKITEELAKRIADLGVKKAVAVAINPQTGGILSLVSLPSYDNNVFSLGDENKIKEYFNDKNNPLFNQAVYGFYLPGSTIKPFLAIGALEEKIVSPEKQFICGEKIEIVDRWNPKKVWTFKDWAVHGVVDMRKALAESSNIYFYTIGGGYKDQKGLGPSNIKKYLELFGWNKKTGIDLPNEKEGFIPSPEWKKETLKSGWVDGDTYLLSIGQQYVKISPMEMALSYVPIANNGRMYQPQLVKSIIDDEGKIIQEFNPKLIKENFFDLENLKVVREGMRHAVTGENAPLASGKSLNDLPVAVALKTGTAQTYQDQKGNWHYTVWVNVFAPYENPEILLTIMIDDVDQLSLVTLPVAKEVLNWYFTRQKK